MEMPAVGENSKKILIVEDNDDNRDILVYRLKSIGAVDVLEARNGKEALEIAAQSRPSLIFMDLKMPVMDGLTATRAIRQEEWGQEIYIIARMTALQKLHKAYAVTGAVCLGAAAKIKGTIVNEIFRQIIPDNPPTIRIGRPSGTIQVEMEIEKKEGRLRLTKAALARTARLLMDGQVYVPD